MSEFGKSYIYHLYFRLARGFGDDDIIYFHLQSVEYSDTCIWKFWNLYTEKGVSLIYGKRKNFFELKKVLLIQKNCLWSTEIDLFTLKKKFLNEQNFL